MASNMLMKASFLLSAVPLILTTGDQSQCPKSNTLLEISGDAILIVFVDANYGQYCNISSSKAIQQISTALHVIQTLNEYDYLPGWQLGLRVFDTCQDRVELFKRVLEVAIRQDCAPDYGVGILLPFTYDSMLSSFRDYGVLPIVSYEEQNYTESTIDILTHYLSTRYETVDLVLASSDHVLDRFLRVSRDAGVCVKYDGRANGTEPNVAETEAVIVAIGKTDDIQRWLRKEKEESKDPGKTWLLLSLDNSDVDDLVPVGSYIVRPEAFDFDRTLSNADEFLKNSEDSMRRSPYLLGIGKAIVGLTKVLRERNCPADNNTDDGSCIVSQFRRESWQEIRDSDVYEALHVQPRTHSVRYVVAMKTQRDLVEVALYGIEAYTLRVHPAKTLPGMPGLCLQNLVGNCENCTNFQGRPVEHTAAEDVIERSVLRNGAYVLVLLIAIACGTSVCSVIAIFIVRRFATGETLDGNPALTIVLILANVFTLLTALPFCMADDYFGAESLNSRKILLTTLAFGLTFSIMLSRALFLALTMGDAFVPHINGYLESLMIFFMSGVQVAASVMYFVMNITDSAMIIRSPTFVALLGYDIFLLVSLFVTCCFIIRIQRNYREGKCFLGTAVGLLAVWTVWLICFVVMCPEYRDTIISLGTIGTAYMIIFGVLIPRVYYMITHSAGRKNVRRKYDAVDLPIDSTVSTIIAQSRLFCDYVHPAPERQILQIPLSYPNYYGSPGTSSVYPDRCRVSIQRFSEMPEYNNYGFHAEIEEIDTPRVTSPTCMRDTESLKSPKASNDVIYTQPEIHRAQRVILNEKGDAEIAYNSNNCSPILELPNEMYPMRYKSPTSMKRKRRISNEDEEDGDQNQEDENISRITRF